MDTDEDGESPIRVLLVDDDGIVRGGLRMMLDSAADIAVAAEATDGDECVSLTQRHAPDVVLMDIRMRRMGGIAATAALTALARPPRVIVLTTFDRDEYVFDSLEAGASGFLLKDASPQEIIDGVRVVAAGESMLAPWATRRLITRYVDDRSRASRNEARQQVGELTGRERDVVTAVAEGKSNADIAGNLYLSEATVKTHITRAFGKVGAQNRVQLAIFAYRAGLTAL